jgi:ribosomal protein L16 Arg81 hydroxylase
VAFLDAFLAPFPVADFLAAYWERAPLHVRRDPSAHDGLFDLADADAVLANSGGAWAGSIRVVQDGAATPLARRPGGVEGAYRAYRDGATFVFSALQERVPAVWELYASLAEALHGGVNVNAYLTPPSSTGFATHYDSHDVFVLQTAGAKRWVIHRPPLPLPLVSQEFSKELLPQYLQGAGEPVLEVKLTAGDLLYVPRGFLHAASSGREASLHLTVGVFPPLIGPVLVSALEAAVARDPALRVSLPLDFADDPDSTATSLAKLARDAVDSVDWRAVVASLGPQAAAARRPSLDGHLQDLERLPRLRLDTPVRRRPDCTVTIGLHDDRLRVSFHAKHLDVPAHIEPDIQFISTAGVFTAAQLPGVLDDEGRLVLVRRLVREGALTFA